jgi:transposase
MPKKKHLVDLSLEERESLRQLVRRGKHSSRKVTRARILLLASDASTDEQIVAALKTGFATVERTGKRFVEEGLGCLTERARTRASAQVDRQAESTSDCHRVQHTAEGSRPLDVAIVGRQSFGIEVRLIDRP